MATLHDFFVSEVMEQLERFSNALDAETPDVEQLYRAARAMRGAAQIAREDAAYRATRVLENATRALTGASLSLDVGTIERLRSSADDLRSIARGDDADRRADAIASRWDELGIGAEQPAVHESGAQETRAFLEYAAHEVAGIASELDRSIGALADDAMDREPLKAVLRRQRGLLGSARLDEIPVLAESLRAVEDMTSVIGKLDVAVRHEWLDVFRCARDVLVAAAPLLETGRQPDVTTSLRRLRVLRHELLERHGVGEAVSTAHDEGLSQPQAQDELVLEELIVAAAHSAPATVPEQEAPVEPQPDDDSGVATIPMQEQPDTPSATSVQELPDTPSATSVQELPAAASAMAPAEEHPSVVPAQTSAGASSAGIDVRELQYRGERALQRAAELRPILERMLADTRGGREALAELYDLLRLARE